MARLRTLAALDQLKRVELPDFDPAAVAMVAEAFPKLEVVGDPEPVDVLGRADPFDWRCVGWPRRN